LLFRFLTQTFDDGDLDLAIKMFAEAVSLDDSFARAHSGAGQVLRSSCAGLWRITTTMNWLKDR
jgi:hypothetical protein